MNNIKDYGDLNQKRILLRLDLNVPLKNGFITDDTRIVKILPIINFLIKKDSKIIILSHVGRPKGIKSNPGNSKKYKLSSFELTSTTELSYSKNLTFKLDFVAAEILKPIFLENK